MKIYVEDDTMFVEVLQDETIDMIENTAPIVHIKGTGNVLTINALPEFGTAIGNKVRDVSYGRWSIDYVSKLEKVIIDNITVNVNATNDFSLGAYNSDNCIDIECINGGVIDCPETRGNCVLLYNAEPPEASTKYSTRPFYVLLQEGEEPEFTEQQKYVMGDKFDEWKTRITPYNRPSHIKFLMAMDITPESGYWDKPVPSYYHDVVGAALLFGCNKKQIYDAYLETYWRRSSLFMEMIMKHFMWDLICPNYRDDKELERQVNDGMLGLLYAKGGKPLPEITDKDRSVYKWFLPLADTDISIEHIRECLQKGYEDNSMYSEICKLAEDLFKDSSETVHLATKGDLDFYLSTPEKMNDCLIFCVDRANKIISNTICSKFMRANIAMAKANDMNLGISYNEVNVTHEGKKYIITDNFEEQNPELYQTLQSAVEDGKAKYSYDQPIINILGMTCAGKIVRRFE